MLISVENEYSIMENKRRLCLKAQLFDTNEAHELCMTDGWRDKLLIGLSFILF